MNVTMAYLGRSSLRNQPDGRVAALVFQPNLAREPVSFDAALSRPFRFREGISALHDVVINDLRFKPKDKAAYRAWLEGEKQRLAELRRTEFQRAKEQIARHAQTAVTANLEQAYDRCYKRYWRARDAYSRYLQQNDPYLWRQLMPCDPVITVADDVVFFECFSADESSYGCLTVNRPDGFGQSAVTRLGTTNVDYSWDLYNHFQGLRNYRQTRFQIDPAGFDVQTAGRAEYRQEKIDLPPGWLRGFMQIQGAMAMPMRKVSLSREAVYALLAWLRRHRAWTSPRALRFELLDGQSPRIVMEPWETAVVSLATRYQGPTGEPVRIWGRQRLLVLARALPLIERVDVYLLGTGLPSFWVAHMGEMRLTLGLSGWTANDWTGGSALDLLAPPGEPSAGDITAAANFLQAARSAPFQRIDAALGRTPAVTAQALNHLAHAGQVIYDLADGKYRWRQVLPQALGEAEIGPGSAELVASREIISQGRVAIDSRQEAPGGGSLIVGKAENKPLELLLDADGRIRRGKCVCGHHFKFGLRAGPCRHLLALRWLAQRGPDSGHDSPAAWFDRLRRWANN